MQTGGSENVQKMLNSSITFSGGFLSPISTHFCYLAMLCFILPFFPFLAEWVPSWKTCTLCADNSTSCLGLCGNSIYLSALKQCWFFCAFFVIKIPIRGLAFALTDRGWEGWKGGKRGWSAQKIPRVSSQSDENILNANGEKLPRVKLNSGQTCRKMHRKERGVSSNMQLYFVIIMIFMCCRHLSHVLLNCWMCLNILKHLCYLNANSGRWCRLQNKGIKEVEKRLSTSNHVWWSFLQFALPFFPLLLSIISLSSLGHWFCRLQDWIY